MTSSTNYHSSWRIPVEIMYGNHILYSCAEGYYGNPRRGGGRCKPCNCNPQGSVTSRCDDNGRCVCLSGISGDRCDECQPRYAVENGICICKYYFTEYSMIK